MGADPCKGIRYFVAASEGLGGDSPRRLSTAASQRTKPNTEADQTKTS